jgi:hypothetical protein
VALSFLEAGQAPDSDAHAREGPASLLCGVRHRAIAGPCRSWPCTDRRTLRQLSAMMADHALPVVQLTMEGIARGAFRLNTVFVRPVLRAP